MGFLDPDGATTEVFGVSIAYGVSSYTPDGRLQDVNKKWEKLSYAKYAWLLSQKAKRNQSIIAARKQAEEEAKAFIAGLALIQWRNYCLGNDMPWWMWDAHKIYRRQQLDDCRHYFGD